MRNKILLIILIVFMAVVGVVVFYESAKYTQRKPVESRSIQIIPVPPVVDSNANIAEQGTVKVINVAGNNFSFDVSEIKVKKGEKVKIVFNNKEGFHDWVIDGFNVRTPKIQAGQTAEVEFIADKTGSFEYYCSVGSHRAMGMKGSLIVE